MEKNMIIFISMFVVLALFYLLNLLNQQNHYLKNKNKPHKFMAFLVFAYIVFWAGMRKHYVDTGAYIFSFNNASWSDLSNLDFSFNSGWGFNILEVLFRKCISSNSQIWLMFLAAVSGALVAITFYKYSENYFYSVFLFLATTDFVWMMNGIRQFLVVAILFAATPLIEKNKWFKYFFLVLFCSAIHGTALIMIPIYFFVKCKPWKPQVIVLFGCILFVLFFTSSFTNLLENILKETKYDNISEQFSQDDGVNPLRTLLFCITTFLSYVARKRLPQNDLKINIFTNMSLITSGFYLIAMPTSGILFGRLPIYTQLYQYLLLPYVINNFFDRKTKIIIYLISIVLFLLYFNFAAESMDLYYSSELTGVIF